MRHAVQAAGRFVGLLVKLPAEFEHRHHGFECRDVVAQLLTQLRVSLDGDPATVIGDNHRTVHVDRNADFLRMAGHRLVDSVIDKFADEVVQAAGTVVADVHADPSANVL